MPRVVVKRDVDLTSAIKMCPVQCFHKCPGNVVVINPSECIDCGVCQMESPKGAIVEDNDASETDKKFNAEKSKECPKA